MQDRLDTAADSDITCLIRRLRHGDTTAQPELIALVYPELRTIAARLLQRERTEHTFQTTDLVHEAYLRLARGPADWRDRVHFFAIASQVMRHVLVDHARARVAGKRGGNRTRLELVDSLAISDERLEDVIVLEEILKDFEAKDPRAAQVVIFRFYGGMGIDEIAVELNVSPRTVKRDWNYARAWLQTRFDSAGSPDATRP